MTRKINSLIKKQMNIQGNINMNALLIALMILNSGLGSSFSRAQSTTGGGFVWESPNGNSELIDLSKVFIDQGQCPLNRTVEDQISMSPNLSQVLSAVGRQHRYVEIAYRAESARVRVCFAGALNIQNDSATLKTLYGSSQIFMRRGMVEGRAKPVAYRIGQNVFVDTETYAKMKPIDQDMLWVHELGHSFVYSDLQSPNRRYEPRDYDDLLLYTGKSADMSKVSRLWGWTRLLHDMYATGASRADITRGIEVYGLDFPRDDQFFNQNFERVKLALNRKADPKQRIQAIAGLDWIEMTDAKYPKLAHTDIRELEKFLQAHYSVVFQILKELKPGWETLVRTQVAEKGLSPFQFVPGFGTLAQTVVDQAVRSEDPELINWLVDTAAMGENQAESKRAFFQAIMQGNIYALPTPQLVDTFDPNSELMLRTFESGLSEYEGRQPLFVVAVQYQRWEWVNAFLDSGKVTASTKGRALSVMSKIDLGASNATPSQAQQLVRNIYENILQSQAKVQSVHLVQAFQARQGYQVARLIEKTKLDSSQVVDLIAARFESQEGIDLLQKIIQIHALDVNTPNLMQVLPIDQAVSQKSELLIDVLIRNGADRFGQNLPADQRWFCSRLIQTNQGATLLPYLRKIEMRDMIELVRLQTIASTLRNRDAALSAINTRIAEVSAK